MGFAVLLFVIVLLLALAGALVYLRQGMPAAAPEPEADSAVAEAAPPEPEPTPAKIIVGDHADQALMAIESSDAGGQYAKGQPLDSRNPVIRQLSALAQAAVPALAADAHQRLVEVLIKGELVHAVDGQGLRVFAIEGGGEQDLPIEIRELQDGIDPIAAWQLAALVIAQKHLKDLAEKLAGIKDGMFRLSPYLDFQRKSQLESTFDYVEQFGAAVKAGELPDTIRRQLDDCEREVLEVQGYLGKEHRQNVDKSVENKDMLGTELLATGITKKIEKLEELFNGMLVCIKTRIVVWHVLSLYPGEQQRKEACRTSIQQALSAFPSILAHRTKSIIAEISNVKSMFDSESKLNERRRALGKVHKAAEMAIEQKIELANEQFRHTGELMAMHERALRLLFEFGGDTLLGAREAN